MDYVVLARKLRPTRFEHLIGQDTVARALTNAIQTGRIAHAFLFAGSRGVGKTSTARILTKAFNCEAPELGEPCNVCRNCTEIHNNASPDVYEIDAASNRGIDNIRELRENTSYVPVNCTYKTYIIDEVHMLTTESFNALLKTLEEPPPHVKFILATTSPHKIPDTILSRCQRYDFSRIPVKVMTGFLSDVTSREGVQIGLAALETIARNATGGVRDALTALDQVISFAGNAPTDEQVARILGLTDNQEVHTLLSAILDKALEPALDAFNAVQDRGHDLTVLLETLIETVKDFSLFHSLRENSTHFSEHRPDTLALFKAYRGKTTLDELQQIFYLLLELEGQIKRSEFSRACFEMGLVKACRVAPLVGIPELLNKARALAGGPSGQSSGGPSGRATGGQSGPSSGSPPRGSDAAGVNTPPVQHQSPPAPGAEREAGSGRAEPEPPRNAPPVLTTDRATEGGRSEAGTPEEAAASPDIAGANPLRAEASTVAVEPESPPAETAPPPPESQEPLGAQAVSADPPEPGLPEPPPAEFFPLPEEAPPEYLQSLPPQADRGAPEEPPLEEASPGERGEFPERQNASSALSHPAPLNGGVPVPPNGSMPPNGRITPQGSPHPAPRTHIPGSMLPKSVLEDSQQAGAPEAGARYLAMPEPLEDALCEHPRWRALVEKSDGAGKMLGAKLRRSEVASIDEQGLTLILPDSGASLSVDELNALRPLLDEGFSPAFHIRLNDDKNITARFEHTIAGRKQLIEAGRIAGLRSLAENDPSVQRILHFFPKGKVIAITLAEESAPEQNNRREDV